MSIQSVRLLAANTFLVIINNHEKKIVESIAWVLNQSCHTSMMAEQESSKLAAVRTAIRSTASAFVHCFDKASLHF